MFNPFNTTECMSDKRDLKEIIGKFSNINRDALIPMLQEVQDEIGYVREDAVKIIGQYLKLPTSKIYGLATFYNQFRFSPLGKYHITVCNGTGCHLEGSKTIITEIEKILNISDGETTRDGLFSLELVSCIGACGQAPVIAVNDTYYQQVDKARLKEILHYYREEEAR